jgi:hypothetical protein
MNLVPSSSSITWSMICSADCPAIGLPQMWQCGWPMRLDVPALPLGVDRVEGQRRLARSGQPGDDHQRVARQADRDVLEVVLTSARDDDRVVRRHLQPV